MNTVNDIKKICAVGTGAMGFSTAICFAAAGYDVALYGRSQKSLDTCMEDIRATLEHYKKRNHIKPPNTISDIMGRIKMTTDLAEAAAGADLVIESLVENLADKQEYFAQLDKLCPPHTLFATNSSAIIPTDISKNLGEERQKLFASTHFWNPPDLLPLVEIAPGKHTSAETMDTLDALLKKIGKKTVRMKREAHGLIGNKLQAALLREAFHIVAEGIASAEDVDTVIKLTLGRRLAITGPLESADLGGLDVFKSIFESVGEHLCRDTGVPAQLKEAVEAGNLGAKTGAGIYEWQGDQLAALKQARVDELLRHHERTQSSGNGNGHGNGSSHGNGHHHESLADHSLPVPTVPVSQPHQHEGVQVLAAGG